MIVNAFLLLAALAFLLLSGGLAIWVTFTLRDARQRVWKTTSGVVTASEVVPNRRCNGMPGHHYRLAYEFSIDGEEFRGNRVRVGDFRYFTRERARRIVEKYPVGKAVVVNYAPSFSLDHPDREPVTVLEPGFNVECWYPIGVLAVSLAIASVLVLGLL